VNETLHGVVEQRLREISQRYTRGRRAVVELLVKAGRPVSIEDIAQKAPRLPRSSAYRHLVDLQQAGVVRRVPANDEYFRFELAEEITEHHHHLVCTKCARVTDVTPTTAFEQAMSRYLADLARATGFVSRDHRLDILGTCAACMASASASRVTDGGPVAIGAGGLAHEH
jgi:Fur family transcriptional regulator, ferric uptake regulator